MLLGLGITKVIYIVLWDITKLQSFSNVLRRELASYESIEITKKSQENREPKNEIV